MDTQQTTEETTQVSLEGRFKIVSDGFSDTTKIFYNDTQLSGITNLNIHLDAEVGIAMANFTVLMPLLNIELPSSSVKITRTNFSQLDLSKILKADDLNSLFDKKEAVDKNSDS